MRSIPVGEDPTGIAIGEDGDIWVINQGDSTVNRIDPETGEVTPAKSTLGIPTGVAAGEGAVWITNGFGSQSGTQVVMVDPTDDSVEIAFPIGQREGDRRGVRLDLACRRRPRPRASVRPRGPVGRADRDPHRRRRDRRRGSAFTGGGEWGGRGHLGRERARRHDRPDRPRDERGCRHGSRSSRRRPSRPTTAASGSTSEANDRVHHFDPVDGRALRTYQHGRRASPTGRRRSSIAPSGVWVGSDLETAVARIDPETNTIDRRRSGGITGGMAVDANGDVWVTVRAQQA